MTPEREQQPVSLPPSPTTERRKTPETHILTGLVNLAIMEKNLDLQTSLKTAIKKYNPDISFEQFLEQNPIISKFINQEIKEFIEQEIQKGKNKQFREEQKDPLTNLVKKEYFAQRYDLEINFLNKRMENNTALVMVIFDIDNFKLINNEIGHPGGDAVLTKIGHTLKGSPKSETEKPTQGITRMSDSIFHIGGDEFGALLIIPETDISTTLSRLHKQLTDITYKDTAGNEQKIGISMGARIIKPKTDGSTPTFAESYDKTDEILALAKHNGKNRFEVLNSNEEIPEAVKDENWYIQTILRHNQRELDKITDTTLRQQAEESLKNIGKLTYQQSLLDKQQNLSTSKS